MYDNPENEKAINIKISASVVVQIGMDEDGYQQTAPTLHYKPLACFPSQRRDERLLDV